MTETFKYLDAQPIYMLEKFLGNDDESEAHVEEGDDGYPFMEVDMRLFSVTVAGTPDDSLDDVQEKLNEQVESRLDEVRELKRHDRELEREFTGESDAPNRYNQ